MSNEFSAISVQSDPSIVVAVIKGSWLLERTTPSWRIKDPLRGFQRRVDEKRAAKIADIILDQGRTFPNAIVLATDKEIRVTDNGLLDYPKRTRFLVVDGQHRLWAQHFSKNDANYCAMIHSRLSEEDMARLFIEINDTQKRVPSSLRWDLVRLVRDEYDLYTTIASEMVYRLTADEGSPLYQRIDLTGEQKALPLKQGSIAPEIRRVVSIKASPLKGQSDQVVNSALVAYFAAIRAKDPDGWASSMGNLYENRVIRALLRLLPEILLEIDEDPERVMAGTFFEYIDRIDLDSVDKDQIRAQQGSAGIKAITDFLRAQILGE